MDLRENRSNLNGIVDVTQYHCGNRDYLGALSYTRILSTITAYTHSQMEGRDEILNTPSPQPHPSVLISSSSGTQQPLSKNAQKKLAKAAILAAKRKEKRAYEKQKRKEARRLHAAQKKSEYENGEGEVEDERDEEHQLDDSGENPRRKRPRIAEEDGTSSTGKKGGKNTFKARVVVDLGFDELMSENVSSSLVSIYSPPDTLKS